MSDFVSLNTALSGLFAAQAAINVTSDNIANANTPGHTRQRVDLVERRPHNMPIGQVGSGVDVAAITRARDEFLDGRVRAGSAAAARLGVRADILGRLESALGEPGGGIGTALSELFSSFEDLALDPSEQASRRSVIGALEAVAEQVRQLASEWDRVSTLTGEEQTSATTEVNDLLRELVGVNRGLVEGAATGGENNGLLDRRDMIMDRLAELGGFTFVEQEHGIIRVSSAGIGLVDHTSVIELVNDPTTGAVTIPTGQQVNVSGMLGGYQSVIGTDLAELRNGLDTFAEEFTTILNATHAAGFTPSGTAGGDLLAIGIDGARSLTVAISGPDALAAAGSGPPVAEFDADNAEALANLRNDLVADGGTTSLEGLWRNVVVDAGSRSASARSSGQAQLQLQQAAEAARSNAHGISLDEEMVNLIRYQRAYEAAGRVITAIDEMIDLLVNRLGLVGR